MTIGTGDNALYHKWFQGGWSHWTDHGGTLNGPPGVVSSVTDRLDIFANNANSHLLHTTG
jgi:hypothetical protein